MERKEMVKIIRIICDSYPNFNPNDLSETVDVWNEMLKEYTYNQIALALKAYILSDTKGFAPSIGQLVDKVHSITQPQELNEMEAWSLVSKAIRNSGYRCNEEYLKLPVAVQRAVGVPEQLRIWATDEEYNETVVMSNFQRAYRAEIAKKSEFGKLPKQMQGMISQNENPARIEMQNRINMISGELAEKSRLLIEGNGNTSHSVSDAVMDSVHAELERIRNFEL